MSKSFSDPALETQLPHQVWDPIEAAGLRAWQAF